MTFADPGRAATIDHVGVVAADLDACAGEFLRLGFTLTELARHGSVAADGGFVASGTGNRCIMLRQGYLELIGLVGPNASSTTLTRFLAAYAGIHVVTLGVGDAIAAQARLARAGFTVELLDSSRAADPAEPNGAQASFQRLPLTDADPRLQLLRHLTPELVWQEPFLSHANHAVALESVLIAASAPAVFAERLSRAAGVAVLPDSRDGFRLNLPQGSVRVLSPEALLRVLPNAAIPSLPFVAGVVLRTDDGNAAVARLLGSAAQRTTAGLTTQVAGVSLIFVA